MPVEPSYDDLVAENVAQCQVIDEQRVELEALRGEVATLKRLVGRDSSNSSMPPSTDSLSKRRRAVQARKSTRAAANRKPGKQPGADGKHLAQVADPDHVVVHSVGCCEQCGAGLGDAEIAGVVTRQVFDIPQPCPVVSEHRAEKRRCGCGHLNIAEFPTGVGAPTTYGPRVRAVAVYLMARQHIPFERTAEAVADLFGLKVSTGWLDSLYTQAAVRLDPFLASVAAQLKGAEVIGVDETSDRVGTDSCWFHVARTEGLTLLHADGSRGQTAADATGVLPGFSGTMVHDRLAMYFNYTDASHAICCAHLLRNLESVAVGWDQTWAKDMAQLLRHTKTLADDALAEGHNTLTKDQLTDLDCRYTTIVADAFTANPEPQGRKRDPIERESYNLAVAFRDHQPGILTFARDLRVPFDNNGAERDLRMVKLHRKISGCFRNIHGAQRLAAVRSYIATTHKHQHQALDTLTALFNGQAWIPPPTT